MPGLWFPRWLLAPSCSPKHRNWGPGLLPWGKRTLLPSPLLTYWKYLEGILGLQDFTIIFANFSGLFGLGDVSHDNDCLDGSLPLSLMSFLKIAKRFCDRKSQTSKQGSSSKKSRDGMRCCVGTNQPPSANSQKLLKTTKVLCVRFFCKVNNLQMTSLKMKIAYFALWRNTICASFWNYYLSNIKTSNVLCFVLLYGWLVIFHLLYNAESSPSLFFSTNKWDLCNKNPGRIRFLAWL